jgi:hypothetical protein
MLLPTAVRVAERRAKSNAGDFVDDIDHKRRKAAPGVVLSFPVSRKLLTLEVIMASSKTSTPSFQNIKATQIFTPIAAVCQRKRPLRNKIQKKCRHDSKKLQS